jgi:hypothetical protein
MIILKHTMKRDEPTDGRVTCADSPLKRVCRSIQQSPRCLVKVRELVHTMLGVVLPTVDAHRGGLRYLSWTDELSFAEATFPYANESIARGKRWFASIADYVQACCRAGAKRLLLRAFRDELQLSPEKRWRVIDRCVRRAYCAGSSRMPIAWTACRGVDLYPYFKSTDEPDEAVLCVMRACLVDGDSAETAIPATAAAAGVTDEVEEDTCAPLAWCRPAFIAGMLAAYSRCAAAVRVIAETARGSRQISDALSVVLASMSTTAHTGSAIREVVEGCRSAGMRDADFTPQVRGDLLMRTLVTELRNSEDGSTDVITWLWEAEPDDHIRSELLDKVAHAPLFNIACHSNDAHKIAWAAERRPVSKETVQAAFELALSSGRVRVLDYIYINMRDSLTTRGLDQAIRSSGLDRISISVVHWDCQRHAYEAAAIPERDDALRRAGLATVATFLSEDTCPATFKVLVDNNAFSREALTDVSRRVGGAFSRPTDWSLATLQWVADLMGCDASSLFRLGDLLSLRCYRDVAHAHPEWFDGRKIAELLAGGEVELADQVAKSNPDLVDAVARAVSESPVWTAGRRDDAGYGVSSLRPATVEGAGTCLFGSSCPRLVRWLAARGHPLRNVSEAFLLDVVADLPFRPGVTFDDVAAMADLYRRTSVSSGSTAVSREWPRMLSNLSAGGYADAAHLLATALGVVPSNEVDVDVGVDEEDDDGYGE